MTTYTINPKNGMKLLSNCCGWFGPNTDLLQCIRWLAGRCEANTLSANVKLEAAVDFLVKYFDIEHGFRI